MASAVAWRYQAHPFFGAPQKRTFTDGLLRLRCGSGRDEEVIPVHSDALSNASGLVAELTEATDAGGDRVLQVPPTITKRALDEFLCFVYDPSSIQADTWPITEATRGTVVEARTADLQRAWDYVAAADFFRGVPAAFRAVGLALTRMHDVQRDEPGEERLYAQELSRVDRFKVVLPQATYRSLLGMIWQRIQEGLASGYTSFLNNFLMLTDVLGTVSQQTMLMLLKMASECNTRYSTLYYTSCIWPPAQLFFERDFTFVATGCHGPEVTYLSTSSPRDHFTFSMSGLEGTFPFYGKNPTNSPWPFPMVDAEYMFVYFDTDVDGGDNFGFSVKPYDHYQGDRAFFGQIRGTATYKCDDGEVVVDVPDWVHEAGHFPEEFIKSEHTKRVFTFKGAYRACAPFMPTLC